MDTRTIATKTEIKAKKMAKCPFDGFECEKHTERIDRWRREVERMAKNHINHAFYTSADMFENCERIGTCIRYINLMRQPPQKTK